MHTCLTVADGAVERAMLERLSPETSQKEPSQKRGKPGGADKKLDQLVR